MADTYRAVGSLLFNETQNRKLATCEDMATAKRLAKALDLLDTVQNANGPIAINAATIRPLSEAEIMQRAREAAIAEMSWMDEIDRHNIREGGCAPSAVKAAARALRDLSKPLSELAPAVDPDLAEARRIAAERASKPDQHDPLGHWCAHRVERINRGEADDSPIVADLLAAIRRGRDLERKACATIAAAPFGQREAQRLGDQLRAGLDR